MILVLNFGLRAGHIAIRLIRHIGLHLVAALIVLSMFLHLTHLYRVQQIQRAAGRVQGALVQIESSQRLYLITRNPASLRKYGFYRKVLDSRLQSLCRLIPVNEANREICRSINTLIAAKLDEMQSTVTLVDHGRVAEAFAIVSNGVGVDYTDRIEQALDHIRFDHGGSPADSVACMVHASR